jgi:ATP-binding cassette subfamily C protein CydC
MGGDIDAIGDVVVRAVVPLGVAVTVSAISVVISITVLPAAGFALLACLMVAGLGAAGLSWRSSLLAAEAGAAAHARVAVAALAGMESGTEHRVWGTTADAALELREADAGFGTAADLAARPLALASALNVAASGVALFAGVALGVSAAAAGHIGPTSAAIVALLPLAAFEAVGAVPGAVEQAFRARVAARRVVALAGGSLDAPATPGPVPVSATEPATPTLHLESLSAAWPDMVPTTPVTVTVEAGGALGVVGRSGIGKSTLLLTIAGALPPAAGSVTVDGRIVDQADAGLVFALTPEDAHLFGTTVLENLRVARGEVLESEAIEALRAVGLADWLDSLPDGLDTLIGSGGGTVSGGERRRLLLARALLSPAPIHLIDEPAEHLDADGVDALRSAVHAMRARGHSVVIVTHDMAILDAVDQVVSLDV